MRLVYFRPRYTRSLQHTETSNKILFADTYSPLVRVLDHVCTKYPFIDALNNIRHPTV